MLYVASQTRQMDVKDFSAHENSFCPPYISDLHKRRKNSNKYDVVRCILKSNEVLRRLPLNVIFLASLSIGLL